MRNALPVVDSRCKIGGEQAYVRGELIGEELVRILSLLKEQGPKWNIGDVLKSSSGDMRIVKSSVDQAKAERLKILRNS